MSMLKQSLLTVLGMALAAAVSAQPVPAEQRLGEEVQLALVRLIESGAFADTAGENIAFTLDEPARRVNNLGLLVDSASAERARDGLRVLGVTPRSAAQRMGVKAGDRIVALNGTSLVGLGSDPAGHAQAAATMRTLVDAQADGAPLEFELQRDGKPVTVRGEISSITLPPIHLKVGRDELLASTAVASRREPEIGGAGSGCGRFNDFDVAPRQQDLYGAKLLMIDGVSTGPAGVHQFRVSAGTHTLKLAELIPAKVYRRQNPTRLGDGPEIKTMTVTVKADTTYYLAAKFNEDKRNSRVSGEYWEPVVWREKPDKCG
ncbi:MAG TPA: PDZ domain-containing protein [Tahibacter sp.]|uniref:PDZ domain-containing protein n=1 Tax=Tahibacter sp. TaxID=2056211 RepID=UPI002C09FDF8|nr:PDZ domain-containing protein [Tahibacter sp.]HSX60514.1 PDZ domain-containing protein [Tahibacter sp.]